MCILFFSKFYSISRWMQSQGISNPHCTQHWWAVLLALFLLSISLTQILNLYRSLFSGATFNMSSTVLSISIILYMLLFLQLLNMCTWNMLILYYRSTLRWQATLLRSYFSNNWGSVNLMTTVDMSIVLVKI